MSTDFDYHAPGVPVEGVDKDGPSYFFPSSKKRTAESQEQRDGLASRWMYRGHKEAIKSVCVTGEDPFGRIRVASTDGRGLHSWLELSDDDSVKNTSGEYEGIACITLVTRLDVLAASSVSLLPQNAHVAVFFYVQEYYRSNGVALESSRGSTLNREKTVLSYKAF